MFSAPLINITINVHTEIHTDILKERRDGAQFILHFLNCFYVSPILESKVINKIISIILYLRFTSAE